MSLKPLESIVSKAVYDAIMNKARNLDLWEIAQLQTALQENLPVERITEKLRRHFLDVGMSVVKALEKQRSGNA